MRAKTDRDVTINTALVKLCFDGVNYPSQMIVVETARRAKHCE